MKISLDKITPNPRNLRTELAGIADLASSLAAQGQHVPIVVQPADDGQYLLLAGHRRLAAAKTLKWPELDADVREPITPAEQIALMIAENAERDGLTAAEVATGYQQMLDLGMTRRDVAQRLGVTQKRVGAYVGMLKHVPAEQQARLNSSQISVEHLIALARFESYPEAYEQLSQRLGHAAFMEVVAAWDEKKQRFDAWSKWFKNLPKEFPDVPVLDETVEGATVARLHGQVNHLFERKRLGIPAKLAEQITAARTVAYVAYATRLGEWHNQYCPSAAVFSSRHWGAGTLEYICLAPESHVAKAPVAANASDAPSQPGSAPQPNPGGTPIADEAKAAAAAERAKVAAILAEESQVRAAALWRHVTDVDYADTQARMVADFVAAFTANTVSTRSRCLVRVTGTADAAGIKQRLQNLSIPALARLEHVLAVAAIDGDLLVAESRHRWGTEAIADLKKLGYEPGKALLQLMEQSA